MVGEAFWLRPDWSGGDNLRDPGTQPFWLKDPLAERPLPDRVCRRCRRFVCDCANQPLAVPKVTDKTHYCWRPSCAGLFPMSNGLCKWCKRPRVRCQLLGHRHRVKRKVGPTYHWGCSCCGAETTGPSDIADRLRLETDYDWKHGTPLSLEALAGEPFWR